MLTSTFKDLSTAYHASKIGVLNGKAKRLLQCVDLTLLSTSVTGMPMYSSLHMRVALSLFDRQVYAFRFKPRRQSACVRIFYFQSAFSLVVSDIVNSRILQDRLYAKRDLA